MRTHTMCDNLPRSTLLNEANWLFAIPAWWSSQQENMMSVSDRHTPYSLVAFLAAFPKISINIDKNFHFQQYYLSNLRWFIIPRPIVSAVLEGFKGKREHCYARKSWKEEETSTWVKIRFKYSRLCKRHVGMHEELYMDNLKFFWCVFVFFVYIMRGVLIWEEVVQIGHVLGQLKHFDKTNKLVDLDFKLFPSPELGRFVTGTNSIDYGVQIVKYWRSETAVARTEFSLTYALTSSLDFRVQRVLRPVFFSHLVICVYHLDWMVKKGTVDRQISSNVIC